MPRPTPPPPPAGRAVTVARRRARALAVACTVLVVASLFVSLVSLGRWHGARSAAAMGYPAAGAGASTGTPSLSGASVSGPPGSSATGTQPSATTVTASQSSSQSSSTASTSRTAPLTTTQKQAVEAVLDQHSSIRIGVAVEDTATGVTSTVGSTAKFTAASTGKVLTAVAWYHLVETGDKTLTQQVGSASARQQIQVMINQSSNDAWHALRLAIGLDRLSDYAQSIGIDDYAIPANQLTPSEMASLLGKLWSGRLINAAHRAELLGFMQHTNMELMIPSVTPADVELHHKYGVLDGYLHDAAILSYGGRSYAVVVYTQGASMADVLSRVVVIRQVASVIIPYLFPGQTPLTPSAPTSFS